MSKKSLSHSLSTVSLVITIPIAIIFVFSMVLTWILSIFVGYNIISEPTILGVNLIFWLVPILVHARPLFISLLLIGFVGFVCAALFGERFRANLHAMTVLVFLVYYLIYLKAIL